MTFKKSFSVVEMKYCYGDQLMNCDEKASPDMFTSDQMCYFWKVCFSCDCIPFRQTFLNEGFLKIEMEPFVAIVL